MIENGFITVTLPNGQTFAIRLEHSGVVLEAPNRVVDEELAIDMLWIKMWKFGLMPAVGRA